MHSFVWAARGVHAGAFNDGAAKRKSKSAPSHFLIHRGACIALGRVYHQDALFGVLSDMRSGENETTPLLRLLRGAGITTIAVICV